MVVRTVEPREAYNKEKFVNAMTDLNNLESLLINASKPEGNWNPNIRKGLGNILRDDQGFYAGFTPDNVLNDNQEAISQYTDEMDQYVKNTWKTIFNKLEAEDFLNLASSLPLPDSVRDNELDEIINAIKESKIIEFAESRGSEGKTAYIISKLQDAEQWRQEAYFGYSSYVQDYNERTFNAYKREAQIKLKNAITKKDGSLNKTKLSNLIEKSYSSMVTDKGEDSDEAKAYRIGTAKAAYEREAA